MCICGYNVKCRNFARNMTMDIFIKNSCKWKDGKTSILLIKCIIVNHLKELYFLEVVCVTEKITICPHLCFYSNFTFLEFTVHKSPPLSKTEHPSPQKNKICDKMLPPPPLQIPYWFSLYPFFSCSFLSIFSETAASIISNVRPGIVIPSLTVT